MNVFATVPVSVPWLHETGRLYHRGAPRQDGGPARSSTQDADGVGRISRHDVSLPRQVTFAPTENNTMHFYI